MQKKSWGKVAVLFGGTSAEREISLISGKGVLQAFLNQGVDAFGVDLGENYLQQLYELKCDYVFNILHGGSGENGEVQAILNARRLPYAGSGPAACALAMDKWRSKLVWQSLGLPVLPAVILTHPEKQMHELTYPVCVKPACEGSTVGISRVNKKEELAEAYAKASQYHGMVLAEPFIIGREFTVGVLGKKALPPLEIVAPQGFYDYEAKYVKHETQYHCPCDLPVAEQEKLKEITEKAFFALGCQHWGRIDFMRDQQGRYWILEANTVPGMTPRSNMPMMARAEGISYEDLVTNILAMALPPAERL